MATSTCLKSYRFERRNLNLRPRRRQLRAQHDAATGVTRFEDFVLKQQASVAEAALDLERRAGYTGPGFCEDRWERASSDSPRAAQGSTAGQKGEAPRGYGITRVMENGAVLEKAAVNVSVIHGVLSEARAKAMFARGREEVDQKGGQLFHAVALSLVFHPASPFVPTLRADVRMFEVGGSVWVGGGCDLTPCYLTHVDAVSGHKISLREDISGFHQAWKDLCDGYSPELYSACKSHCDEYFYIPCRQEFRGTGGIFFDDLPAKGSNFNAVAFAEACAHLFLPSWLPIAQRRAMLPVSLDQRLWQKLRRGRYIEFNFFYDRGVRFGLDGGSSRVESIFVSCPPDVAWRYLQSVQPASASAEEEMLNVLRKPLTWC